MTRSISGIIGFRLFSLPSCAQTSQPMNDLHTALTALDDATRANEPAVLSPQEAAALLDYVRRHGIKAATFLAGRLAEERRGRKHTPPRYDDVYLDGMAALDD